MKAMHTIYLTTMIFMVFMMSIPFTFFQQGRIIIADACSKVQQTDDVQVNAILRHSMAMGVLDPEKLAQYLEERKDTALTLSVFQALVGTFAWNPGKRTLNEYLTVLDTRFRNVKEVVANIKDRDLLKKTRDELKNREIRLKNETAATSDRTSFWIPVRIRMLVEKRLSEVRS